MVTVTLVPAFSAVWMLPVVTMALFPLDVKFGLAVMLALLSSVWMVMSYGSSSQLPALPPPAPRALTLPLASSTALPEVSTKPPLPPVPAPSAEIFP